MININLLHEDAKIPARGSEESAGLDLHTIDSATIPPGIQAVVKTGIAMSMPVGFVGFIWSRSKLSIKLGLVASLIKICDKTGQIMGGVVDSDYRGQVMIGLLNTSHDPIEIRTGDKVAQMVIQKHYSDMQINIVEDLDETSRGKAGVNSSEMRLR